MHRKKSFDCGQLGMQTYVPTSAHNTYTNPRSNQNMLATAHMEAAHTIPLPSRPTIATIRSAWNLVSDKEDSDDDNEHRNPPGSLSCLITIDVSLSPVFATMQP